MTERAAWSDSAAAAPDLSHVLAFLTAPPADRPGYREEWRS